MSDKSRDKQAKGAGKGGIVPPVKSRWKKGQSGNPKGMPPRTETQKQLKELLVKWFNETDEKGKSNLRKQIEKLAKVKSEKGARLLIEYGFGKVRDELDITSGGEPLPIVGIEVVKPDGDA